MLLLKIIHEMKLSFDRSVEGISSSKDTKTIHTIIKMRTNIQLIHQS